MSHVRNQARFYSPQIDGLRFLAALAVFIHHAPLVRPLGLIKEHGWIGVDLFLSISAFLITRLILLEHERTGRFDVKAFYIRRVLRIWPLYLTFVTAMCVLAVVRSHSSGVDAARWWLSHLTFSNNLLTALRGYNGQPEFTAHLWTISLEEQAYLIMPLALTAFLAASSPTLTAVRICLGAVGVLILARLAFYDAPHPFVWTLPLRGDSFLLGSAAAILTAAGTLKPKLWMMPVGLTAVCMVALFPPIEQPSLYRVIGYTVVAAGCTAIVTGSQALTDGPLATRPMRYLGKISYGLYVYHQLAIRSAQWIVRHSGAAEAWAMPLGLVLTIVTAAVSYRLLERPFLRLKRRHEQIETRPI